MRAMRRLIALVVVAALCLSLAVTPAVAKDAPGNASSSTLCDEHGAPASEGRSPVASRDVRGFASRTSGRSTRTCPPRRRARPRPISPRPVPVYFHVITDGGVGNLTARQLDAQVAVLNKTFGGREGGFRTNFSFYLAGVTRTDNAAWFAGQQRERDEEGAAPGRERCPQRLHRRTAGAYLGWAYLPEILTKPGSAHLDGIVLDWESVPGVSDTYAGQYDLGETLTHEAGHWLNLEHTFYGGCNAKGDFVDDTPAQKIATFGCPEGQDSCKAPGIDPIHNYMDYSFDSCYTEFTAGQAQRMRDAWLLYRAP